MLKTITTFHCFLSGKSRLLAGLFAILGVLTVVGIGLYWAMSHHPGESSVFYHKSNSILRLIVWTWFFVAILCTVQGFMKESLVVRVWKSFNWLKNTSLLFKINLIASTVALIASMYFSTGTLSPYANTVNFPPQYPLVEPKCHYLFNGDYHHFSALFFLLDGKPKDCWGYSVVQRRILYNCLAYPFMKLFEHDLGGIITNALLTLFAFWSFAFFAHRTIGKTAALAGMWLLALYPGITYYSGQPFLYAIIVPGCLWLYMLLWKLNSCMTLKNVCAISLVAGLLFTGYDFMPVFGPAILMILFFKKKYSFIPVAIVGMLLCTFVWWALLHFVFGGVFSSENSAIYKNIAMSYLHPAAFSGLLALAPGLPKILCANFVFSCFLFLPMFFLVAVIIVKKQTILQETCLILVCLGIMLINNCSPSIDYKWHMQGTWAARIYQPIFVVFLFYALRAYEATITKKPYRLKGWLLTAALGATILGNGIIALGPLCNDPFSISSTMYWRFYKHSPPDTMKMNLAKYGRRPWGFCR